MKTCSVWSKRRDQYQSDNRETNNKTKPFKHKVFKQNRPNIIFLNIFCLLLYDYFYGFVRISLLFIHFVSKLCTPIQVHKKLVPSVGTEAQFMYNKKNNTTKR